MIGDTLRLHEELLLLCRTEAGRVVGNGHHAYMLGAAILGELLFHKRVVLDQAGRKTLIRMVDTRLLGDPFLDEASERVRNSPRVKPASTWVPRFAGLPKLTARLTERLWLYGLLRKEERPVLFLFKRTVFATAHPLPRKRVVERLSNTILNDDPVEPRTAMLLALARGNGLLPQVLDRKQLKRRKARIKAVVEGHAIARALSEAVAASTPHHAAGG